MNKIFKDIGRSYSASFTQKEKRYMMGRLSSYNYAENIRVMINFCEAANSLEEM